MYMHIAIEFLHIIYLLLNMECSIQSLCNVDSTEVHNGKNTSYYIAAWITRFIGTMYPLMLGSALCV